MLFRSFFDEQLAHMSYLVGCQRTGEAIVIDPARDIEPYIRTAEKEGLTITAATETHIHADFVSGAKELAKRCGATLYLSDEGDENWKYQYLDEVNYVLVKEGSVFSVGNVEFKVIHTPGHTPESISFILTDKGGGATKPMGIFTGDFVFVGDIGRPDLLEKAAGVVGTADSGARQMFQSLKKFKELPDYLQVWPAHGAGSACGKALGAVPVSTIGYEKMTNWALQIENEEEFVSALLAGQPEPPKYFAMMKKINKIGPAYVNNEPVPVLASVRTLEQYKGAVLLDVRPSAQFAKGHYKGSINIPFNKSFTTWAGWLLRYDQDIVLIAEEKEIESIRKSLASIGFDRVVAVIEPSVLLAGEAMDERYEEIDVHQLKQLLSEDDYYLIDVRNQAEWEEGRIESAHHIMLGTLLDRLHELPKGKTYVVQCRSGARSAIAASLLQANGYTEVLNVKGGYLAWTKEKLPVVK
ncbi:hydroxyacylglutathione hydrolase [Anoxybacillus voinovskiensis]|uniref:Hydroxyacylglutathione hydrolase n=1 Tax=Anoxybacteroides voinovskiense TaxID=230470 RepID=A0A840E0Q8_9BACL|nr:MBL fold metallo-hydrolase [Anoxybacillus voinovskiensis]MBB4074796.1 hydroxyacylglutathione hydrolase [Anoxybacillus voinovskiensis]